MLTSLSGTYKNGTIILDEVPSIDHDVPVIVTFLEDNKLSKAKGKGVRLGSWSGKYSLPDNFNEPLDDLADYM
ncbi:hypothetical protein DYU11_28325 [Fibrisoma montanum]|uniref:DUF2281 domain-containing protein n=1 Tax=Fibrisoma montanum TaxID=2305895 RepID=A0A418LZ34_9BACT|nr:hypothetical protein [Fibrisoma montanum]RIV18481.1 hypothetical protein DYU11_28325 [Fibrisoma montanum]